MTTFILNDAPYGSERSYNGLRLAVSLCKKGEDVQVFLMGDAAACGKAGQTTPNGYYNLGRMAQSLLKRGGKIYACGTCCEARGIAEKELIEGVVKSDLETITNWVAGSDKVLVF